MNKALELYVKATTGLQQLNRSERGQGTIEYVGILFIVAAICAAVLTFVKGADGTPIGQAVIDAVVKAIQDLVG